MRRNGSRSAPSPSATSSGTPSTRLQDFHCAMASSPSVATNSGTVRPLSRCSSMTATAAGSSPSGGNVRMVTPANSRHEHADFHANTAHLAAEHDALAIEFDVTNLSVRAAVARRIAHGQGVGVEPQRAARPRGPVDTHIDASKLPAGLMCPVMPRSCRRAVGIGLRGLVNRALRAASRRMIDGALPRMVQISETPSNPGDLRTI